MKKVYTPTSSDPLESYYLATANMEARENFVKTWSYESERPKSFHYKYTDSILSEPIDAAHFYKLNNIGEATLQSDLSLLTPDITKDQYHDALDRIFTKITHPSWGAKTSITLQVPYLNQLDIPVIGESACASTCSAMVLAYYGLIQPTYHTMMQAAESIFSDTSSIEDGLLSRDNLKNHLEINWDIRSVNFDDAKQPELYETIKNQIQQGKPTILGSRSMTSVGHYIVVIGYEGEDYKDGKLIVNDPNGHWHGYDDYHTDESGAALHYDFTRITSESSDGVFILTL